MKAMNKSLKEIVEILSRHREELFRLLCRR